MTRDILTRLHAGAVRAARALALVGGVVLVALMLLTVASIIGRSLSGLVRADWVLGVAPGLSRALLEAGLGPIKGSFDLVEAGMAFCIFAFLPLCQVTAGHAAVTLVVDRLPGPLRRALVLAVDVLFATVLVVVALQLEQGMQRYLRSGQTSFLLEMPLWWSYAASLVGAGAAALSGIWVALVRAGELALGETVIKEDLA